jgi:subtilisin family serine protease
MPLTEVEISRLAQLGLRITETQEHTTYRLRGVTDTNLDQIRQLEFVTNVVPYEPARKLDDNLRAASASVSSGAIAAAEVSVLITLDPHTSPDATVAALAQIGQVLQSNQRRALVRIDASRITEIAELPGVVAAEVEPEHRTTNNIARGLIHVDIAASTLGLDGAGEIVGVADSGLDNGVNDATLLADFAGRIVGIDATVNKAAFGVADGADLNNHGTHVCGSILGSGANSNGNITGMAPAAQLTMLSMGPNNSTGLVVPFDLTTGVFQSAYDDGARLHNNSWGSTGATNFGKYKAQSEDVDEFVRAHTDMLIVFAAGNDGPAASTVTPPGTAKNCLTVGASESLRPLPANISINPNLQDEDFNPATPEVNVPLAINGVGAEADNPEHIATFSSRGPMNDTGDTRIQPDIVAPGTWILSCRSSVSTADVGPDGVQHGAFGGSPPYADDRDGAATHTEAVGRGLPGAPFFGTWNQNTPDAPAGSGPLYQTNYFYDSGTSMAAPITTGAATLLRQYMLQRRGHASPSAALLKAMLINSATVPVGESNAPNNTRGFGWLNLERTLTPTPTGQQNFSDDINLAVATGDVRQFSVQLADPGQPLRVTLVWTDYPGKGVQNKLYLRLIPPGAGAVDGDVTAFPTVSNNIQRVHIDAPVPGVYTVEVHGIDVTHGIDPLLPAVRQDFALTVINGVGFSPNPVDIAQVIDHSGSMGFYSFMEPAKERAKQLVDMLRINDHTGVVAFDGTATTVNPIVPIADFTTQDAIKNNIDLITPGGVTSIGGGLQLGQIELTAGGDPGHPQAIVLLSDGHENTPPWSGEVPGSPPGWYGGPDFSEALPGIPSSTRIYTVSLGVQSDEVLLQAIAVARGGVFHAIHSPADIGQLHEIYVHLQALAGGEEVITSGSASVGAISAPLRQVTLETNRHIDGALLHTFSVLLDPAVLAAEPSLMALPGSNSHNISIDETVESVAMLVSWHDPRRPVELTLISPSNQVFAPGSALHYNKTGSSYQFFRIDRPEPGLWHLQVSIKGEALDELKGARTYTWGAYGTTPLRLRAKLPEKLIELPELKIAATLNDRSKLVRSLQIAGTVRVPLLTANELIAKYADTLKSIDLPFEPDNPQLDPNLFKLVVLDSRLRARGRPTIFTTRSRRLNLTLLNGYTTVVNTLVHGLYGVHLQTTGRTRGGHIFARQFQCSARV